MLMPSAQPLNPLLGLCLLGMQGNGEAHLPNGGLFCVWGYAAPGGEMERTSGASRKARVIPRLITGW